MKGKSKLSFTLTGNFQYDLGILGLKSVLDFFEIKYASDEYSISIDRDKEKLLEDIISKLTIDNGVNYFFEKVSKNLKNNEKGEKGKKKKNNEKRGDRINIDVDFKSIYRQSELSGLIDKIASLISEKINDEIENKEIKIKEIVWQKSVNLLNNILLNFQADMNVKGEGTLNKVKDKLNADIFETSNCSFCNTRQGKRLTRDAFFFAPSQYNTFWFNEPTLFICPECLVSNLAITQSFIFLGNKQDALVFYTPNLKEMEELNNALRSHFNNLRSYNFAYIFKPLIEYEKNVLKKETTIKELQVFNFKLDSQNPLMELFILQESTIKNLIKIENEINSLFNENNVNSLFGYVVGMKDGQYIDFAKEFLQTISQNQKVFYLVTKYARYCIMSEKFRQNNIKKPPVKGFSAKTFLKFLKIHFKLEGYMNEFQSFQDLGQRIRQRIFMILTENQTKQINWNTFDNKIISLSNSFLNVSKASLQQFQELLARTIINLGLNTNIDVIKSITDKNFSEVATTIALAVLVAGSDERRNNETNATEDIEEEI